MINKQLIQTGLKINEGAISLIPKGVKVKYRAPSVLGEIELKSNLHIGAYTYFEKGRIGSLHMIGNYCSVAPGCSIGNGNHPVDYLTTHPIGFKAAGLFNFDSKVRSYEGGMERTPEVIKSAPVIGNDVWIGGGVTILRGVKIGNGAIIGANTVVSKDVPDYAVVVGAPMRTLRMRFNDAQVKRLQALKWWDYDLITLPDLSFNDIDMAIEQVDTAISSGMVELIEKTRPWQLKVF